MMEAVKEKVELQRYAEYKDSGVEWLGEIPKHWMLEKTKYLWEEKADLAKTEEHTLLSVSQYTGVGINKEDSRSDSLIGYKKVDENDLVINIMLAWLGGLGLSPYSGVVSPSYAVYKLVYDADSKFLHYLYRTKTYLAEFARKSTGVVPSRWRMYTDDFGQVLTLLPPKEEQTAIANFLDRKTEQINQAIEIKQKQIELLKERRQILIHKAVTRGLNPDAPLKPSGVDWMGDIPEHWEVKQLRFLFRFLNTKRIPLSAVEREEMQGKYPYYGASGIIDYVDDYLFDEPTILIAEDGANLLNKSTPLAFEASGKYWVNNHAHILKPLIEGFKFWAELLSSMDYTIYISGAAQPKLTKDNLAGIKLPVPPKEEITEIIDYIKKFDDPISEEIKQTRLQITKLKEYKSTLINSAVTGKIKVS